MRYKRRALLVIIFFQTIGFTGFSQLIVNRDMVIAPASIQYIMTSALGRLLSGTNYRREWSIPVAMPVFRLKESGFIIKELGGGMQTKSLSLWDKNKREWVLRSVKKEAMNAIPKKFRYPIVVNFVQDQISAAHPYAPLVVSYLAQANKIVAPRPKLYFVPDDENLGPYRKIFANTLCFLERREPTPDNSETESTARIMEEILEDNDHLILQETVLKARLLDMLVGDWDRHADQWRWGAVDSGRAKYYYAIPRDRDQAFFRTNGLVPWLVQIFAMKHTSGFKKSSKGLKNLNFKSWRFDKTFLNELDKTVWSRVIKEFQANLTDDVIMAAVQKLPGEIYPISRTMLEDRLKKRRNTLLKNAMKYYEFISGIVDISGSEDAELFEVKKQGEEIIISVYRMLENAEPTKKIYERIFDRADTRFVNLEGLGGNDRFVFDENITSGIKIKISGGEGKDMYDLKGKLKTIVYDSLSDNNTINNQSKAKIILKRHLP